MCFFLCVHVCVFVVVVFLVNVFLCIISFVSPYLYVPYHTLFVFVNGQKHVFC